MIPKPRKIFKTTKLIPDDDRFVSEPEPNYKKNFFTDLSHYLFGCYYLESMRHATANECLYCGLHRKDNPKRNK